MTETPAVATHSDAPSLQLARTLLFVPGNRPERFAKAMDTGADAVVLDLEDSVPAAAKDTARIAIVQAWPHLRSVPVPIVLRINSPTSAHGKDDLVLLQQMAGLDAVMVPKAESAYDLEIASRALPGVALLPLIESAAGLHAIGEIARAPNVLRLVVGHIDFMADMGLRVSDDERELDTLRFSVALHTRLTGLAPAIDGVTAAFDDDQRLRNDTRRALNFGFGGKLCIHPRQVAVVHEAIAPSPDELAWAQRVVEADASSGGAAVQLDGRMIDLPVVLQARRTIARKRSA